MGMEYREDVQEALEKMWEGEHEAIDDSELLRYTTDGLEFVVDMEYPEGLGEVTLLINASVAELTRRLGLKVEEDDREEVNRLTGILVEASTNVAKLGFMNYAYELASEDRSWPNRPFPMIEEWSGKHV